MAVDLVTVTGNLETLAGAAPLLGRVWFRISRADWTLSGEIFAPEYVEVIADSVTGAFSVDLQSTDDFEAGSTYAAVLKYREPLDAKDREFTIGTFALPSGGPYQLGDLMSVPVAAPVPADVLALCQAYAAATAADSVQTGLDRTAAAADVALTHADVSLADAARIASEAARDAAIAGSILTWPTTAAGIGPGIAGVTSIVAGSGGANGTFALAYSGGTQVLAPVGVFTVAGGALVSVIITYPGYYSAGTPTLSFAASAGLTGASATAVMAANTPVNGFFTVPSALAVEAVLLYKNVAGVATLQKSYPSSAAIPTFKGALTAGAAMSSVQEAGVYYLTPSAGYTDVPAGFDTIRGYDLFVWATVSTAGRWFHQRLQRADKPEDVWVRRLDTVSTGTTAWYFTPTVLPASIATSNIQTAAITNPLIAAKAVTRAKLADEFDFQGVLATGDTNALFTSGTYLLTAPLSNIPSGAPAQGYLNVRGYNGGSFVVQDYVHITQPELSWRRYLRPFSAVYGPWVSMAIPTGTLPFFGKNIVCIGDSITELGDYPARLAARLSANVTKIGFGGCRMGKHETNTSGLLYDKMCMYNLARYINTGDSSELITAANDLFINNGDDNRPQAATFAAVNWATTDVLVIFFGTNDWAGNLPLGTASSADGTTFRGAINYSVDKILSAYPNLKIVFIAPMWRSRNVGGDGLDADTNPRGDGAYLIEFVDAAIAQANLNKIPALDLYRTSGVNKYNHTTLLADGLHPATGVGYQRVADKVASFMTAQL